MVEIVRRRLGVKRVGHTGTLDPFATGLLVVLVGRATRLSQYLISLRKTYQGTMKLGVSTDTHDLTGNVIDENDGWRRIERSRIDAAAAALIGRQAQRPPKYSAKKVGGQRAHRLARKGKEVELDSREIEVFDFTPLGFDAGELEFRCDVSSGTYVRALARDLGAALECGAHLKTLRRTGVGDFRIENAQDISAIDPESVRVGSPAEAVGHLPGVSIESEEVRKKVSHGQPVPAHDCQEDLVALLFGEKLVAVAEKHGEILKPRVVLEG